MNHVPIDPDFVSKFLDYAPELGGSCLRWKIDMRAGRYGNRVNAKAGSMAGSPDRKGYYLVMLNKQMYKAHRIVMAIVSGVDPVYQVDHINGDKKNNTFENLRIAPRNNADNQQNLAIRRNNTSGYAGVYFNSVNKKWIAQISANKVRKYLGSFNTPEEAHNAYVKAKSILHTFEPKVRK